MTDWEKIIKKPVRGILPLVGYIGKQDSNRVKRYLESVQSKSERAKPSILPTKVENSIKLKTSFKHLDKKIAYSKVVTKKLLECAERDLVNARRVTDVLLKCVITINTEEKNCLNDILHRLMLKARTDTSIFAVSSVLTDDKRQYKSLRLPRINVIMNMHRFIVNEHTSNNAGELGYCPVTTMIAFKPGKFWTFHNAMFYNDNPLKELITGCYTHCNSGFELDKHQSIVTEDSAKYYVQHSPIMEDGSIRQLATTTAEQVELSDKLHNARVMYLGTSIGRTPYRLSKHPMVNIAYWSLTIADELEFDRAIAVVNLKK